MRILVVSPRVAPGLLTLGAWDALRAATSIHAADRDDPQVQAIINSGFVVTHGDLSAGYDTDAVWIAPSGDHPWSADLAGALLDDETRDVEVIFGSYDARGAKLLDLVEVMRQLRAHCPWTSQQTHASLSHYLLEETHETLEALDAGDSDHLRDELGDLLMQVVFHAQVAEDAGEWAIDDVAEAIVAKLIYRNPHVFGDEEAADAAAVDVRWQQLKALESPRSSVLDGIAPTLPALATADKVLARLGVTPALSDTVGDRLLVLVAEARSAGLNAEEELRKSVRALAAR